MWEAMVNFIPLKSMEGNKKYLVRLRFQRKQGVMFVFIDDVPYVEEEHEDGESKYDKQP